jgi:hypothetical protein
MDNNFSLVIKLVNNNGYWKVINYQNLDDIILHIITHHYCNSWYIIENFKMNHNFFDVNSFLDEIKNFENNSVFFDNKEIIFVQGEIFKNFLDYKKYYISKYQNLKDKTSPENLKVITMCNNYINCFNEFYTKLLNFGVVNN